MKIRDLMKAVRIIFGLLMVVFVSIHMMSYRQSNQDYDGFFQKYAKEHQVPHKLDSITIGRHTIQVAIIGNKNKNQILLLHGAPGNMLSFRQYFKSGRLLNDYQIILVDRPGYGKSSKKTIPDIKDQGDLIRQAIREYRGNNITTIGHSYGGPLALYLALRHPRSVEKAILLASPVDPSHEKIRAISHVIKTRFGSRLSPSIITAANEEKLGHIEALKKLVPLYQQTQTPVTAWFSARDWVMYAEPNKIFLENHIDDRWLNTKMWTGFVHDDRLYNTEVLESYLSDNSSGIQ